MQVAGSAGSLENLLNFFFSFLHRRTDFYIEADVDLFKKKLATMGFPPGEAEKMLLKSFRKLPKKRAPPANGEQQQQRQRQTSSSSFAASSSTSSKSLATPPSAQQQDQDQHQQQPSTAQTATAQPKPSTQQPTSDGKTGKFDGVKYNEKDEQLPIANGGIADGYYWVQSLDETTAYVTCPPTTRGKDIDCTITSSKISLKLKADGRVLVEGAFPHKVSTGESLWNLDVENEVIVVTLDKVVKTWWENLVEGGPKIDTSKVDSTMRVDEYDETTQASIRKIMFDQAQKRKGLPSSDDILGVNDGVEKMMANAPPMPNLPVRPDDNYYEEQPMTGREGGD